MLVNGVKRGPAKRFDPDEALEKAMEVFWAHGYAGSALSDLLKVMGINKKSLYDTFGNKRSLFIQCLDYYSKTSITCLESRLDKPSGKEIIKELKIILKEWSERYGNKNCIGCFLGNNIADFDKSDEEICTLLQNQLKLLEVTFTRALKKAESYQDISLKKSPASIARHLVCLSQGVAIVGKIMDSHLTTTHAIKLASKSLLP